MMVKVHTTLSVDNEIIKKARKMDMNMSSVAEKAIAEKAGEVTFNTNEGTKCDFCGIELPQQTKNNLKKGLCWLWPDERWICPRCLRTKDKGVIAGKKC